MTPSSARDRFGRYARPRLMELLTAIGLDVAYERASGDVLTYRRADGETVEVLDLLGGYGATLLGHNNPRVVARARELLDAQRPFHAQASVRAMAGDLAARLSAIVSRTTGREYVVTLASSGAEAVEAAIKHAEMEMVQRIDAILERLKRTMKELRVRLREHTAVVREPIFDRAARLLGVPRVADLEDLFLRVFRHDIDAFSVEPCFLSLEGAFHGKSTGAVKLTHNPDYRSPWQRIGLRVAFVRPGDRDGLARVIAAERVPYLDVAIDDAGELSIEERSLVNISACFVEPIQGEGGIREVPTEDLRALRQAAGEGGFPLVLDEIQSGMGRTGTFLASEPAGVRGDYYLLSKTLGGGLAKVSALLVDRERYIAEFGYLHTSTFAEDDHGSAIALAALDEIEADGGRVMALCREKGSRLLEALRSLARDYPAELLDVRGRGLMIGVELAPRPRSPSPLIRVLSEQGLLGFVASGYLLHEHRIRAAPALSSHGTLRVEPSAYVEDAELDRFVRALEELLEILRAADAYRLARFTVGRTGQESGPRDLARQEPAFTAPGYAPPRHARKVAFLGHFLEAGDLRDWDPALAPWSDDECETFLERTRGLLDPFIVDRHDVSSLRGDVVSVTVIGIPFSSRMAIESHRKGDSRWAIEMVEKGVALARRLGCALVGFGGYTSIVTDNCKAIVEDEIGLTSGNSLTAAAAIDAVRQATRRLGIDVARLGVVGAAGNIGSVLAEVAADHVGDILLVGRPGATRRLEQVAAEIYFGAYKRLVREDSLEGLAGAIARTATVKEMREGGERRVPRIGEALRAGIAEELGPWAPVRIDTEMDALRRCNVVVTATNAARPILGAAHLGEGPVVVCDVATPRDVDPAVKERGDVTLLRGGIVRAPLGQTLQIGGMPLKDGQVYGCLAETILLGFASVGDNFSYGKLTPYLVRRIRELATMYGFSIEELPA